MSWVSGLAHKVFSNDPHVVLHSIESGAARGAVVAGVAGEFAGGVGAIPAAIGGGIIGAAGGTIVGTARYFIGTALWGHGR